MPEQSTCRLDIPLLEYHPEEGGPAQPIELRHLPFTLGRGASNDRTLASARISRDHAAITRHGDGYAVRDLGSTNGTFVNGERVQHSVLADGDILHLAHLEFCFRSGDGTIHPPQPADAAANATMRLPTARPDSLIRDGRLVAELIEKGAVRTVFQPIVDLATRRPVGFEALGRGTHPSLTDRPAPLLELADQFQLAVQLSQLFRRRAVCDASSLPSGSTIFLNVHARELAAREFFESLTPVGGYLGGGLRFVLEIAEASVTDVSSMARAREALRELGYGLAYDDFGAGQARLLELVDVPPDYLKLDRAMIDGIDHAASRQQLVSALVTVVAEAGVRVVAEGIETEPTASMCESLGCHLGQGFLFGDPDRPPVRA